MGEAVAIRDLKEEKKQFKFQFQIKEINVFDEVMVATDADEDTKSFKDGKCTVNSANQASKRLFKYAKRKRK